MPRLHAYLRKRGPLADRLDQACRHYLRQGVAEDAARAATAEFGEPR
jgi:hypothetical protein